MEAWLHQKASGALHPARAGWLGFICAWMLLLVGTSSAYVQSYHDPVGYPALWPASLATYAYTSQGSPQADLTSSSDNSSGANPVGASDFSSGDAGDQPSFYYYGDGSILYFRLRVAGPPLALVGRGQPFSSLTWNILIDTDGDGYKEYVVMLEGTDGGDQPDDIVVIYDNSTTQSFTISQDGIWRQDCAGTSDGVNGGSGTSATWDTDPDEYVWDFGRTRVVQLDRTRPPDSNLSEYYIDIQVPLSALDATLQGGAKLTSSSFFSLFATSSNSNVDPTQKDIIYSGDIALADVPLPGGDLSNPSGITLQAPIILTVSSTACPAPITLSTSVLDALIVNPVTGQSEDTIDSVTFEYYFDLNENGIADDAGQAWTLIGSASRTATLGLWQLSWDAGLLNNGKYLIRANAVDTQGHATVSTSQPYLTPASVSAVFNNVCSRVAAMEYSTKAVSDLNGGETVPGDTLLYTVTVRNTGASSATNVVVTDTLDANTVYVAGTATPAPFATTPALVWNAGTVAAGANTAFGFRAVVSSPVPDGTEVTNKAWIRYDSGGETDLYRLVTANTTVSSRPRISLTKSVNSATAAPGDTLTYTLSYLNYGTDSATEVIIADFVPDHTDYVPNSTRLNDTSTTDASDGDGVTVTGSAMIITVGTVASGGSGQVEFQVRIR